MDQVVTTGILLFYSYSHKDEKYRNKLETHLSALRRDGLISEWHDRKITGGSEWSGQIDSRLESAQVILLLVSPDFLHSDYCHDVELRRALQRHEAKEARVIPIFVRPCDWQSAPFGKLQGLPKDGNPITKWRPQDEGYLDVARGIRKVIQELNSGSQADVTLVTPPVRAQPAVCHEFTSCEHDCIKWTWRWSAAADRPSLEFIERLESWCPSCGRRIEPSDQSDPRPGKIGGRDLYNTGKLYGGYSMTEYVPFTLYFCDHGCTKLKLPGCRADREAAVKREIEHRAIGRETVGDRFIEDVARQDPLDSLKVDINAFHYEETNRTGAFFVVTPHPTRYRAEFGITNQSNRLMFLRSISVRVGGRIYRQADSSDVIKLESGEYKALDLIFPVEDLMGVEQGDFELEVSPAVGGPIKVAGSFPVGIESWYRE